MSEDDIRVQDVEPAEMLDEHDAVVEIDIEAPEEDAAEQQRTIDAGADRFPSSVPDDVDPADAAEQSRVVEYDEDDYR